MKGRRLNVVGKLDQRGHRNRSELLESDVARKRILSVAEAAVYLGVSPKTILEEIHKKKIPAVKVGRAWRIHKDVLDALVKGILRVPEESEEEVMKPLS